MLKKIFKLQSKFNRLVIDRLYYDGFWDFLCQSSPGEMDKEKTKWLLNYNRAQMHESMEFEDSLPWKWWKRDKINNQNLKVELVDELHFFISKCLVAEVTPQELFKLYKKKLKLNYKRQEEGYFSGEYQKIKDGKEDNEQIK